jgi:hypothetical protein
VAESERSDQRHGRIAMDAYLFRVVFRNCRSLGDIVTESRKYQPKRNRLARWIVEPLIMRQGVTIDECAEKYDTTPRKICQLMGWE